MFKKVLSILLFTIFFLGTPVLCFAFTNTDFSGNWVFKGRWASGTITADGHGNITGGSVVVESGDPVSVTGSYMLNNDGMFTILLTAVGKGTLEGQGAMNLSKDIVTFVEYNASYSEFYLNYFLKSKNRKAQPCIPLMLLDD